MSNSRPKSGWRGYARMIDVLEDDPDWVTSVSARTPLGAAYLS